MTGAEGLADEGLAAYVAELRAAPSPSARELGADELRAASVRRRASRPPGPEVGSVIDLDAGSVPVRWYRAGPAGAPLLVWAHGGGWVLGDLESHDRLCRRLVVAAGVDVLAVDYRRAPEHPWPAAVEDVLTVWRWARARGTVVGIAGDSAGGALAALCCLRLRDDGEPQPWVQVLAYPNTDLTLAQPSVREKGSGWGLGADDLGWFVEQWVPAPELRRDPRVSPLAEPDLSGLAPAVVVTAEHDPLRDEGAAYAAALAAAGVPVVQRVEPGQVHGFLGLDLVSPAAEAAGQRLFADVRTQLRD